jgi:hypothetical protein
LPLLAFIVGRLGRGELFDLGRQGLDVGIECLEQQALLLTGIGFAGSGELEPLEDGHLVGELVDQRLLAAHLPQQPAGKLLELLRVEGVEVRW